MLLAIDVGNTHLVAGLWNGTQWLAVWRRATQAADTEDELGVWLNGAFGLSGLPFAADGVVYASVVPQLNHSIERLASKWLRCQAVPVTASANLGLTVKYEPPTAVGADRIANALGALSRYTPPIIVVDFGTATTFDAIDASGVYVGGAILPGVEVSAVSLSGRTAKLPQIDLRPPERAIGTTTADSLRSGIVLGYAGAIDELAKRIDAELGGGCTVVATGGLGEMFVDLCERVKTYDPHLTLDGLVLAHHRLTS